MAKPTVFVILCGLCSWKNIHGGHGWHSILKYKCCIACANIVQCTSKLRMYKLNEAQCKLCNGQYPKSTNLMRGGQVQHFAFLLVLVTYDIMRKIFKQLSKNFQKPGKLSPCWSDLRVIIATLRTRTLEVTKRSPNQPNQ
jgi:hypothetical protein